jgi:hypothetical protein
LEQPALFEALTNEWLDREGEAALTNGKGFFIGFVVRLPGASVHTYISTEMFYAETGN